MQHGEHYLNSDPYPTACSFRLLDADCFYAVERDTTGDLEIIVTISRDVDTWRQRTCAGHWNLRI